MFLNTKAKYLKLEQSQFVIVIAYHRAAEQDNQQLCKSPKFSIYNIWTYY